MFAKQTITGTLKHRTVLRDGLMLIEVVCATFLAGTLLAAVLVATANQTRQAKHAEHRLAACDVLDSLLARWERLDGLARGPESGLVPGRNEWEYETSIIAERTVYDVPMRVQRVSVRRVSSDADETQATFPTTSVNLLLPTAGFPE